MKKPAIVLCLSILVIFGLSNSEAKRDPFKVFIELDPSPEEESLSPLERYEISQLKLMGIIGSESQGYRALVEDRAGAGFILTEGMLIGSLGSTIKEIRRDRVIILEKYRDYLGKEKAREVLWTVNPPIHQSSMSREKGHGVSR